MPKLALVLVLLVLVALASTMTYTGYLVVGVLAAYLDTSRVVAGLLLGALFARFPWIRQGKFRVVGLVPGPLRRPLIVGILGLCLLHFLSLGDYVPVSVLGFTMGFLLAYPWLRKAVFDRVVSSVFKFTGRKTGKPVDDRVIDAEFREKKE